MIDLRRERPMPLSKAAKFCSVDRRTIERWIAKGLESIKIGGKVYTSRAALQRFATGTRPPSRYRSTRELKEEERMGRELEAAGF